jgi:alkanesulfonate monooxygenase SsuD/methylene tetrahydromethanopterin reductase-like flavin-dependent oxidoreductase (luciferase family)
MRVGFLSVVDHYPRELERTSQRFYEEVLEQAEAAEELGFDSYWVAEHHFHEYGGIPRTAIWMAAASARTRRIRLGSAVVCLPFDNPLRTAEDFAMVDILSNGRLQLGVGSGYLQHEYAGFGIDMAERRERFAEALEILTAAWSGDRFSFHGKFHRVDAVQLNVRPVQRPRPPISIAILNNDRAAAVGAQGYSIMMIPYATTEDLTEIAGTTAAFRDAFTRGGRSGEEASAYFALHTHCAPTSAQARREGEPAMDRYVRTRLYAKQRSFDSIASKDLLAVGDPEEVSRVLGRYAAAGFTHALLINNFGGLEHRAVLRSMESIARHVLPVIDPEAASQS